MRDKELNFFSLTISDIVLMIVFGDGLAFVKIGYGMFKKIAGIENSGDMPIIPSMAYINNTYIYKA